MMQWGDDQPPSPGVIDWVATIAVILAVVIIWIATH